MLAYWVALGLAICTSLGGQVLLKLGAHAQGSFLAQIFRPPTLIGLCLYGGAALLYIVALRRIPVSVALPCTAVSYVVIAIIGHFGFGEALGAQKIAALGLISCGVLLLAAA